VVTFQRGGTGFKNRLSGKDLIRKRRTISGFQKCHIINRVQSEIKPYLLTVERTKARKRSDGVRSVLEYMKEVPQCVTQEGKLEKSFRKLIKRSQDECRCGMCSARRGEQHCQTSRGREEAKRRRRKVRLRGVNQRGLDSRLAEKEITGRGCKDCKRR